MEKFELFTDSFGKEHIIIDNGDGSYTSMTKENWDKLQAQKEAGLGGTL